MKTMAITISSILLVLNLFQVHNVNTSSLIDLENIMIPVNNMNRTSTSVLTDLRTSTEKLADTAYLTILTSINNKCDICTSIEVDELFTNHIFIATDNKYEERLQIPSSESGWTVEFFPAPAENTIQYDVKQTFETGIREWNVTYSSDCHGIIKAGQNKTCIINNDLLLP